MGYQEPKSNMPREPADTQQWIRERFGAGRKRPARTKPSARKALVDKYGKGNPELEDLLHKSPSMTEDHVKQYLAAKKRGVGWEDWSKDFNADQRGRPR